MQILVNVKFLWDTDKVNNNNKNNINNNNNNNDDDNNNNNNNNNNINNNVLKPFSVIFPFFFCLRYIYVHRFFLNI